MRRSSTLVFLALVGGCTADFTLPPAETPLEVTPASATVAPSGAATFVVSGGRKPYTLTPELLSDDDEGAASASLTDAEVSYLAGARGSVVDRLTIADSAGRTLTVPVTVGAPLQVFPAVASVTANGSFPFQAVGGQPPYAFTLEDPAEGTIDEDGNYLAGDNLPDPSGARDGTDLLTLSDSNGVSVTARIILGAPLQVLPAELAIAPGGSAAIQATGGTTPYTFAVADPTGAPLTGVTIGADGRLSVDATVTVAGEDVDAVVTVTDRGVGTATANVDITPALAATSIGPVATGTSVDLRATGGTPPYAWRFSERGNISGGTVTPSGQYVSGPNAHHLDHLEVTDAAGITVAIEAIVGDTVVRQSDLEAVMVVDRADQSVRTSIVDGHMVFTGGHLQVRPDGSLLPRRFPEVAIHDLDDLHADGLPEILASTFGGGTLLYTVTAGGDVQLLASGPPASHGALIPGLVPRIALSNVQGCDLALFTVADFQAQTPTSCRSDGVGTGPIAVDGNRLFLVTDGGATEYDLKAGLVLGRTHCPDASGLVPLAPVHSVRVDGDAEADLAYLVASDKDLKVRGCRVGKGISGNALLDMPLVGNLNTTIQLHADPATGALIVATETEASVLQALSLGLNYSWSALDLPIDGALFGVGDADGDSFTDLLVRDTFGNLVLVQGTALGSGANLGRPATNRFRIGNQGAEFQLARGDFDGDGHQDLFATGGGGVSIHLGTTEADFPVLAQGPQVKGPGRLVGAEDVDGDGRTELVAVGASLELTLIEADDAGAAITTPIFMDAAQAATLGTTFGAFLRDFEQDGTLWDFVLLIGTAGQLESLALVLVGDDPGSTVLVKDAAVLDPVVHPDRPLFLDFDQDGTLDLVATDACNDPAGCQATTRDVYFYKGQGTAESWTLGTGQSLGQVTGAGSLIAGSDGEVLFLSRCPDATCTNLVPVAITRLTATAAYGPFVIASGHAVSVDNDAYHEVLDLDPSTAGLDLVASTFDTPPSPSLSFFRLPTNPAQNIGRAWTTPMGNHPQGRAIALDLEADGSPDLAGINGASRSYVPVVHLWHQTGPLRFEPASRQIIGPRG